MSMFTKVYLGVETGGAGELLKTGDPAANYGGFESPTSGQAGSYASGGSISMDGTYKIHTFTTDNDGTDVFSVTSEISNAEILVVGAGGGGCAGGGGGGEVIYLTGVTIPVDDYTMNVGAGGAGIYQRTTAGGTDGGDTTAFTGDALAETAEGGGGGGAFASTGHDGHAGGCGGGGAGWTHSTTGGASTSADDATDHGKAGRGNGGINTAGPYWPGGGGGGAAGLGGYPTAVDKAGPGGIGYLCSITGTALRYGGGGGAGLDGWGWGGSGGAGGGGDGTGRTGGNGEDADFYGGGGGGCGQYASGGDGFDGVIIVRYQDTEEANFRGWTETHSTGHIFVEGSDLSDSTDGTVACKIIGADYITSEAETCVANQDRWFGLTIWSKGDGSNGVKYLVKDETGAATIISGETPTSATWKRTFLKFKTPTDCVSMTVKLSTDSTTGVLVDDVSLYDFGPVVFTHNTDVLDFPKPQWGYGFNSNEPDDCVAGTGIATFVLENSTNKYSPEHASVLTSFEEGMQVKMIIESDEWSDPDPLQNGGLELNAVKSSGYTYCAKITIDNTKVADDHTNFPVMVQGTYDGTGGEPDLRSAANGGDVQNVDATATITGSDDAPADLTFSLTPGGTALSHEIELYDASTGQITAWVKIPTMDADTDLDFYMNYGNSAVTTSQEDIANVWTNYHGVWHMSMGSGDALDSKGSNDLSSYGTVSYRQTGKTGYACTWDGSGGDYFAESSIGINFNGQSDMTNMAIIKLVDDNRDQYVLYSNESTGWYWRYDDSSNALLWKLDDGTYDDYGTSSSGGSYGVWLTVHHAIDDANTAHLGYKNGVERYTGHNHDGANNIGDLNDNFYISLTTSGTSVQGDICEVRIENSFMGDNYILTEYNSFESGFYTMGSAFELGDFEDWEETYLVEIESSDVNGGSYAAKITNGADFYSLLHQDVDVQPDNSYKLSLYAKGDFRYKVEPLNYDTTTSSYIVGTDLISDQTGTNAAWGNELSAAFTPECAKIRITLSADAYDDNCLYDDVELVPQETNYTRTKFYGFIESIEPDSGQFDHPVTRVTCRDWMGYCNNQEAGVHAMETSKYADYAIAKLLTDFEDQPQGTEFDSGTEQFDYIFHRMWSKSSMSRALWQLAWNEDGQLYSRGNGVLVFENANGRDDKTSGFTINGTMTEFEIDYSTRNRYNSMVLSFRVKEESTGDIVWDAGDGVIMEANATTIIKCDYRDPTTGEKVWCSSVTEPTTGNGHLTFSGANCTVDSFDVYSDCAIMTITNAGAQETMTKCDIDAADVILERSEVGIEATNTDSIARIGIKRWKSTLDLVDDPIAIKARVDALIEEWAPSHISEANIRILANQNTVLAKALIEAEPNDKFTVAESATGVSKTAFINHIGYEQDSTLLWVNIRADIIEV